jgi:hypothetical protein
METKEGWRLLQVILPRDNDGEPTMLFHKDRPTYMLQVGSDAIDTTDIYKQFGQEFRSILDEQPRKVGVPAVMGAPYGRDLRTAEQPATSEAVMRAGGVDPEKPGDYSGFPAEERQRPDDPINPKHYDGVACCEIIDHMPTNVGLASKYIWRLGEKDPVEQEIGKLIFYLKRQIEIEMNFEDATPYTSQFGFALPQEAERYRKMARDHINKRFGKSDFDVSRATAMTALVCYTITGLIKFLHNAVEEMERVLTIETGTGLAV